MILLPATLAFLLYLAKFHTRVKTPDSAFWVVALITGLVGGLRQNVGADFDIYLDLFAGKVPVNVRDPGFLILTNISAYVDDSGRLGLLSSAVVTVLCVALALTFYDRKTREFTFLAYLSLPLFWVTSLNLVRIQLACAIALLAVSLANKKNRQKLSLGLGGIALSIHLGAIVLLAINLVAKRISSKSLYLLIMLAFLTVPVILFLEPYILSVLGKNYFLEHNSTNSGVKALSFLLFVSFLVCVAIQPANGDERKLLLITYTAYAASIWLWLFSDAANFWLRVSGAVSLGLLLILASYRNVRFEGLPAHLGMACLFYSVAIVTSSLDPNAGYITR